MDALFVVSDPSKIGVETAGRIKDLAKEMELKIGSFVLVLNRLIGEMPHSLEDDISKSGFDMIFTIPSDDAISMFNMEGKDLLSLPSDSKVALEVTTILDEVLKGKSNG